MGILRLRLRLPRARRRRFSAATVTADRGKLHLEARYNYENFNTGSLWIGYNLSVDGEVTLTFTPMVAAVVGDTDGVAPGYNLSVDWWKLAFFSQSEYVIDTSDSANNFLYTWTELSVWPWDWLGAAWWSSGPGSPTSVSRPSPASCSVSPGRTRASPPTSSIWTRATRPWSWARV